MANVLKEYDPHTGWWWYTPVVTGEHYPFLSGFFPWEDLEKETWERYLPDPEEYAAFKARQADESAGDESHHSTLNGGDL